VLWVPSQTWVLHHLPIITRCLNKIVIDLIKRKNPNQVVSRRRISLMLPVEYALIIIIIITIVVVKDTLAPALGTTHPHVKALREIGMTQGLVCLREEDSVHGQREGILTTVMRSPELGRAKNGPTRGSFPWKSFSNPT